MYLSNLFLGILISGLATFAYVDEVIELTSGDWAPYQSESLVYYGAATRIITEADTLERVSYERQNFAKLLRGRIDIAVADVNVAYDVLHEYFTE